MDLQEDADKILAGATSYLVQGQEIYEASILLLSKVTLSISYQYSDNTADLTITLTSNRAIYEIIQDQEHPSNEVIIKAFNAVLPVDYCAKYLTARVEIPHYNDNWRTSLLEIVEGKRPLNQCIPIQEKPRHVWENLFFRSPVEVTVAKSLDRAGVLFLPNCMSRLGLPGNRENREADFLVCYNGRWGILEINGDTFHTNAAKDHDRSRLFKHHGIRTFEVYNAKRCLPNADSVVREFLELLKKNA